MSELYRQIASGGSLKVVILATHVELRYSAVNAAGQGANCDLNDDDVRWLEDVLRSVRLAREGG